MHEVLVNRLGGLSLPRKSVVGLIDRRGMTLDVYCGRKTTTATRVELQFVPFSLKRDYQIDIPTAVYNNNPFYTGNP